MANNLTFLDLSVSLRHGLVTPGHQKIGIIYTLISKDLQDFMKFCVLVLSNPVQKWFVDAVGRGQNQYIELNSFSSSFFTMLIISFLLVFFIYYLFNLKPYNIVFDLFYYFLLPSSFFRIIVLYPTIIHFYKIPSWHLFMCMLNLIYYI